MSKHIMTKISWNLLCMFFILTMLAACSREKASTRSMAQHEAEARAYTVTGNPNQAASSLDERAANDAPVHQQGSSYVEISGDVSINKNTVKVTGHSNLPAGARIKGNLAVKNSLLTGYTDETTIQKDGSFVLQVHRPGIQGSMDLTVLFRPDDQDKEIRNLYGSGGNKLEGPYVYQYEENEQLLQEIRIGAEFDPEQDRHVPLIKPVWNKPKDYGNPQVWIKPDVRQKGNYYHVYARSNLLEGSDVKLTIDFPGRWQFGYDDQTKVMPDGSFSMRVKKPSLANRYTLVISFEPNEDMWINAKQAYGTKGERLAGSLVKSADDKKGSKRIEARVQIQPKSY
ncbi:flagellar motor protein MotB [Paenibacillus polymyxa]|uniref:Ompa/motb domain-containing protein n=2 Tax=Paenibacillus polymyxa TaxID=1406 RepID=A0A378XWF9_PAEPO|nr:flagellar motor protein MotB [Paenibacillus polymyxa]MCC3257920.1 flagellar motor protein MotB [Paenibacillus polymyxa]URJ33777.1 flagellar motor protein MotB [Paenibacillus polymyxa]SUA69372.1 ompa/motb domain-containing protein [Paenibacillus polymyxa]